MRQKKLGLGELEAQIMAALWDDGGWLTPGDVHAVVGKRRRLAYTTVMTVLARLHQKGLLERRRQGRAFAYQPTETREEHAAERMSRLLAESGDQKLALTCFVSSMSAAERAQLRRLLKTRR